ncbi:hypothetical protein COO60DRAFT_1510514, partial [Scenedesmus sp. NREL 46B-D3]
MLLKPLAGSEVWWIFSGASFQVPDRLCSMFDDSRLKHTVRGTSCKLLLPSCACEQWMHAWLAPPLLLMLCCARAGWPPHAQHCTCTVSAPAACRGAILYTTRLQDQSFHASTLMAALFTTSTRWLPSGAAGSDSRCTTRNRRSPAESVTSASASLGGTSSTPEAVACKLPFSLKRTSTIHSPSFWTGPMVLIAGQAKKSEVGDAGLLRC